MKKINEVGNSRPASDLPHDIAIKNEHQQLVDQTAVGSQQMQQAEQVKRTMKCTKSRSTGTETLHLNRVHDGTSKRALRMLRRERTSFVPHPTVHHTRLGPPFTRTDVLLKQPVFPLSLQRSYTTVEMAWPTDAKPVIWTRTRTGDFRFNKLHGSVRPRDLAPVNQCWRQSLSGAGTGRIAPGKQLRGRQRHGSAFK